VARNEWLPIGAIMPAAAARRRIIRQASAWVIDCWVTGIGGWTLRDLLLGGGTVYWVRQPSYVG
jgi:uncharacterized membrane protein YeiH